MERMQGGLGIFNAVPEGSSRGEVKARILCETEGAGSSR
jgi:hypothetical protein